MKKQKSPLKAVYLNIVLPGLGLAYLGRWGYAVLFFFWTPLRLLGGIVLIDNIPLPKFFGAWDVVLRYALMYLWWIIVMYDTCTTPYTLAEEHNRKLESQPLEQPEGHR